MNRLETQYVVDESGRRTAVLMDIEEYNHMIRELESARGGASDAGKVSSGGRISLEGIISGSAVTDEDFEEAKRIWR